MVSAEVASEQAVEVSVRDLAIRYGSKTVLSGVNFEIHKKEIFGIIGPANSGKTSFLRVLNRMDAMTTGMDFSGTVEVLGRDVRKWRNLYALRRNIGVVFPLPDAPRRAKNSFCRISRLSPSTARTEPKRFSMFCSDRKVWLIVPEDLRGSAAATGSARGSKRPSQALRGR